ncbi:MAG TPA: hypothetical protein VEZ24_16345, partial [Microvirga sp.]|nr:hypothetical protein [Microvirga sp.]
LRMSARDQTAKIPRPPGTSGVPIDSGRSLYCRTVPAPDLLTSLTPQAKLSSPRPFRATEPEQSIRSDLSRRVDSEKAHVPADLGG